MAKVTGPLLSLEAKGKFHKAIVYAGSRAGQTARAYKKPNMGPDPRTSRQLFMRGYFQRYTLIWHSADAFFRGFYNAKAKKLKMTGYNAYIGEYSYYRPSHMGNLRMGYSRLGVLTTNF